MATPPLEANGSHLQLRCAQTPVSMTQDSKRGGIVEIQLDTPQVEVAVQGPNTEGSLNLFATSLTSHLNSAFKPWPGLALIKQLCALRAAALLSADFEKFEASSPRNVIQKRIGTSTGIG